MTWFLVDTRYFHDKRFQSKRDGFQIFQRFSCVFKYFNDFRVLIFKILWALFQFLACTHWVKNWIIRAFTWNISSDFENIISTIWKIYQRFWYLYQRFCTSRKKRCVLCCYSKSCEHYFMIYCKNIDIFQRFSCVDIQNLVSIISWYIAKISTYFNVFRVLIFKILWALFQVLACTNWVKIE